MTKEEFEEFLNYLMVRDKQGNIIPINKEQMLLQYERIANFIKKKNWKFVEPEVTFENSSQKIELKLKDE